MYYTVRYLPLGVKNVQQKEVYFCLTEIADYCIVDLAAKTLGVLVSDIKTVEKSNGSY